MSSHVLLNIYNLMIWGKENMQGLESIFVTYFATYLINSIILLFVLMHYISAFFQVCPDDFLG